MQLQLALSIARPGNVIKLAAGTYVGQFTATASGSSSAPIWLCGPRSARLTTGSIHSGHALMVSGVSNFVVTGFTVDTAFKGVTVVSGNRVAITDLAVSNTGFEGIHLRNQTRDSTVSYNTISRTGMQTTKYGEGIYIGTSGANWCELNGCNPDRTQGVHLTGNTISNTGAQPIEVKEGTSSGFITGNILTGSSRIEISSKSLILVKGNGYTVTDNQVKDPRVYGLQTIGSDDWGRVNLFARNRVTGAPSDGIWIHQPGNQGPLGNVVYCSNRSDGPRVTNLTCARD
ncbi:MAG: right-handed parallel beta-helix repeat-containing protein [Nakamurella sp.]